MAGKEVATLFVEIRGSFAKFSADMNQVSKRFNELGRNVQKIGKTFTTAFTVPLGLVTAAAITAAKEMDSAFDTIRGQTGATGAELEGLKTSFKSVFTESVQGAEEVGKAISQLNVGLGLSGKPLEELALQLTGISQVTGQELGSNVKGVISLFNSWNVSTEQQADAMEFLFKVGQKTNQNVGELAASVASFQPTLSRLGLGMRESAALFAQLGKNGLDAGSVMGALGIAVNKFAKANIKDMGPALRVTLEGLKAMPTDTQAAAAAIEIFGKKGAQVASLIRSGKLSVDDFIKSVDNSTESIKKAVGDTDSFSDKLIKFKHSAMAALEPLGGAMLDGLTKALDALKPIVESLGKAFGSLGEGTRATIAGTIALTAAIGPTITAFSFLFGWVGKLGPALMGLRTALLFTAGSLTLLITPLGLLAAAVGVAIAAWYEWDTIGPIIDEFVDETVLSFGFLMDALGRFGTEGVDSITAFGQGIATTFLEMKDSTLAIVEAMVNGIQEWFTGKFDVARQSVITFTDEVKAAFEGLYDAVIGHSSVPDLVDGVGEEFEKLEGNMVPPTQKATAGVENSFTGLLNTIKATSKKGGDEGKKLAQAWVKTSADLKSVMSDINGEIDPLRQNIASLLKNKDFGGLEKLAQSFKGSKDGLDQFRSSLSGAKGDFNDWENNQERLNESLGETKKRLYEMATGKELIDPLTQSVTDLMQAGDMEGLKKLGESMQDTASNSRKFEEALNDSLGSMEKMKQEGVELASALGEGLGELFSAFGSKEGGEWGDLIGKIGGLAVKGGMFGGGKDAAGSSGISGTFGSILEALGITNSTKSETDKFAGAIETATTSLDKLEDTTKKLSSTTQSTNTQAGSFGTWLSGLFGSTGEQAGGMGGLGGVNASQMMSEMSGYVGVATQAIGSIKKLGGNRQEAVEGGGELAGSAIGAYFGGSFGAEIGGAIGGALGKALGDTFGSNAGDDARQQFGSYIEDALRGRNVSFQNQQGQAERFSGNFVMGDNNRFDTAGWEQGAMEKFGEESSRAFDAAGKGLAGLLGITEDIGGQIGVILQENLSGNIDNARLLMLELGVTQQQMEEQFQKAGETGEMSWHAVEVALQGVGALFGEGLVAVGDLAGSFQQIVNSGGDGMDAIRGIQNAAVEAGEAGVQSFDAWRQSLIAAGQDPGYVDSFFAALNQRGLTSLDQIREASTRVLGGVIADMQSNSSTLAEVWTKAQAEADKYLETVSKIPDDSVKNVTLNVSANVDDASAQVLALGDNSNATATSSSIPAFAKGGVVSKPTLGLIGEAGPEAIMPLASLPSIMKNMSVDSMRGNSGGINITVNAPNATPGVSDEIRRMIKDLEFDIINRTIDTVGDLARRGGA